MHWAHFLCFSGQCSIPILEGASSSNIKMTCVYCVFHNDLNIASTIFVDFSLLCFLKEKKGELQLHFLRCQIVQIKCNKFYVLFLDSKRRREKERKGGLSEEFHWSIDRLNVLFKFVF